MLVITTRAIKLIENTLSIEKEAQKIMRLFSIILLLMVLLIPVLGCSKPESKVAGKWINEKTSSSIEFNSDKTGVIHQRTQVGLPPDLAFRWKMVNDGQFEVEVTVPGNPTPSKATGKLEGNDILVLQNDTFKKMK